VYVEADGLTISIASDCTELNFGGFQEEFSYFIVEILSGLSSISAGSAVGNHFFHRCEEITGITIGRLAAVHHLQDGTDISVTVDRSVILHLSGGNLAIARRSLHLEMIEITFSNDLDKPQIRQLSTLYSDEVPRNFEFIEKLISIEDALAEASVYMV
jgi:hypothetical protein